MSTPRRTPPLQPTISRVNRLLRWFIRKSLLSMSTPSKRPQQLSSHSNPAKSLSTTRHLRRLLVISSLKSRLKRWSTHRNQPLSMKETRHSSLFWTFPRQVLPGLLLQHQQSTLSKHLPPRKRVIACMTRKPRVRPCRPLKARQLMSPRTNRLKRLASARLGNPLKSQPKHPRILLPRVRQREHRVRLLPNPRKRIRARHENRPRKTRRQASRPMNQRMSRHYLPRRMALFCRRLNFLKERTRQRCLYLQINQLCCIKSARVHQQLVS